MATTGTVVVPESKAKHSLVVLGLALIALFVIGVLLARFIGSETEEVSTPAAATTGVDTTSAATSEVTKETTTKEWPSDTLLTALLATGAVLFTVGLLYARISVIKVPGGGEITLSQEEKDKVAEKVAEKVNANQVSPEDAPRVTMAALERLAVEKQMLGPAQLSLERVGAAVDEATPPPGG